MADDDARFLIKEFVMPQLVTMNAKMDRVESCQVALKIEDERIKHAIAKQEMLLAQTQDAFLKHCESLELHYNQGYMETIPQKLWRKKPEIAAGGALGTTLAALLYFLIEKILGA